MAPDAGGQDEVSDVIGWLSTLELGLSGKVGPCSISHLNFHATYLANNQTLL